MSFERVAAGALWVALLSVAWVASPPASPDTGAVVVKLLTGELDGVNLPLFALFNLMAVFPMAFMALLSADSTEQRVPKWPFVLSSFALGAFGLLPYFFLRRWGLPRRNDEARWLRVLGSRALGVALLALAIGLVLVFVGGDLTGFTALVRTQQFPFVMSCDFVACCVAGALLSREEARVRGQPWLAWLGLVPALGLPLVLTLRRR